MNNDKDDFFCKKMIDKLLYELRIEVSQLLIDGIINESFVKIQIIGSYDEGAILGIFEYNRSPPSALNCADIIYREIRANYKITEIREKIGNYNYSMNDIGDIKDIIKPDFVQLLSIYRSRESQKLYENYPSNTKLIRANDLLTQIFYGFTRAYHSEDIKDVYAFRMADLPYNELCHQMSFDTIKLDQHKVGLYYSRDLMKFNNEQIKEIKHDQQKQTEAR